MRRGGRSSPRADRHQPTSQTTGIGRDLQPSMLRRDHGCGSAVTSRTLPKSSTGAERRLTQTLSSRSYPVCPTCTRTSRSRTCPWQRRWALSSCTMVKSAATMSGTVRALTSICPVSEWFKHMRRLPGVDKDCSTLGDTTLLVCETAKALQSLGFTVPRHDSHLLPEFINELGTSCGAALLSLLAATPPLPLEQVCKEDGVRSTKASEVDKHFPPTRSARHQVRHVCRGSESVAPMLVQQLRRDGFLVETKSAVDDL